MPSSDPPQWLETTPGHVGVRGGRTPPMQFNISKIKASCWFVMALGIIIMSAAQVTVPMILVVGPILIGFCAVYMWMKELTRNQRQTRSVRYRKTYVPTYSQHEHIGDTERDEIIKQLGDHFAAGRLTLSEYEERSELALSARTRADLSKPLVDLPFMHNGKVLR